MLTIRRILCPGDLSEASYQALRQVLEMASPDAAELHRLNALPLSEVAPGDTSVAVDTSVAQPQLTDRAEAQQNLHDLVRDFMPKQRKTPLKVPCLVRRGDVTREILHAAKAEDIDLIVMATHGLTGWREFVLESVTDEVVCLAPGPVRTSGNAARHKADLELTEPVRG